MSDLFVEGQVISGQLRLIKKLSETPLKTTWRAEFEESKEPALAEIFGPGLSFDQRDALLTRTRRLVNLLHENIVRLYPQSEHLDEQHTLLISKFQLEVESYPSIAPFQGVWPYIRQIARAIEYTQELGFVHGFISPKSILIDANRRAYLRGFTTPAQDVLKDEGYRSPQIRQGHDSVRQDDIYSLGQLLFTSLTGEPFQQGDATTKLLIPDEAKQTLLSMMSESPFDRPTDISIIINTFDKLHSGNGNQTPAANLNLKETTVNAASPQAQPTLSKLPREQNTISSTVVIASLAVMATLAFIVFFILPQLNTSPTQDKNVESATTNTGQAHTATDKTMSNSSKVVAPLEQAKIQKRKETAEKIASSLLRLQIELEDLGGQLWANTEYEQVTQIGNLGDEAYRNQDYNAAIEKYSEGIALLETTLEKVDQIYQTNLDAGNQALLEADAEKAIQAFLIVVAIKPDNAALRGSLNRAQNLREVIQLTNTATAEEKNGELQTALTLFKQAQQLDSKWPEAKAGVSRVQNAIRLNRFNDKMSDAFAALNGKNYDLARNTFTAAQALQPNSTAPGDGLQQVELAILQDAIDNHMTAASEYSNNENWSDAKTELEAVLALSPGTTQAAESLKKAESRLAIQLRLDQFIGQPELMLADKLLQEAKDLTLQAARIRDKGPLLKGRIRKLSHLVSLARIPVTLTINSDNRTNITIFKQGNFGKLEQTSLELFPGVYTIVGKRNGYRDVQQDITLKGTERSLSVDIRASERVR